MILSYKDKLKKMYNQLLSIQKNSNLKANEDLLSLTSEFKDFIKKFIDFKLIIDNFPDEIYISDGAGTTLYANPAYEKSSGILLKEIVGRNISDLEKTGHYFKNPIIPLVIERKETVTSVAYIIKKDKKVFLTGVPVFNKHTRELEYVISFDHDSQYFEKLETQLSKLRDEKEKDYAELTYHRQKQMENGGIYYSDDIMAQIFEMTRNIAQTDVTVLITGESGTGKELVADEIYRNSKRNDKQFIKVNCAAIPAELLESELFGYESGSFTGAKKEGKIGMFELANNGTILLDEIGDMSLPLQTKLLRVIQQREITRVGGTKAIPLDIRIIAATNKNLLKEKNNGNFREDLYYRLNVVPIELPPLRNRKEDIGILTKEFLKNYNSKYGKNVLLDEHVIALFETYPWPGNIRELENLW